ncbi:MAG: tungstate ABC transporter substrate-binding protein WtpA [Gemmatimonas sp.]|nr:tungstate ABC transporter substrate-binding protein WtpA [Gemmatimonas sp.]
MLRRLILALVVFSAACGPRGERPDGSKVLVAFNAGSLAVPMRVALDSFAAREGVEVQQESAGSLETARKLTELGSVPDVIALADEEVFPQLLMPEHVSWYVRFAHNRMVLAHTPRARGADGITGDNWWQVLLRDGVETGRSDPQLDPNGYRTLLVLQLAEHHYAQPGLAERLLRAMPARNVRPKEADLVGLLQAGEFDYIWSYESMAKNLGLDFVRLPEAIDLSSPADSALYATARVKVRGKGADSVEFRGRPIVYALSVPTAAPHRAIGEQFVRYLLSADGRRVLREQGLDALKVPGVVGTGAPAGLVP